MKQARNIPSLRCRVVTTSDHVRIAEITKRLQQVEAEIHTAVIATDRDRLERYMTEHRRLSEEMYGLAPRVFSNPNGAKPLA